MAARNQTAAIPAALGVEVPTTSRWTVHGHAAASFVDQQPRVLWVLVIAVVSLDAEARGAPPDGRFLRRSPSAVRGLF
jgi:hypothetical protein